MCLNSIIRIVDLLEKIVGKAANHEKIKKTYIDTDKFVKSIHIKYKSKQTQK